MIIEELVARRRFRHLPRLEKRSQRKSATKIGAEMSATKPTLSIRPERRTEIDKGGMLRGTGGMSVTSITRRRREAKGKEECKKA